MSMFDDLKNMNLGNLNLGDMMQKARQVQDQMKQMQEELARKEVTSDAGGGMVQATCNGRLELVRLKIDKSKIDPSDTEMLEDVIVAAVHAAQTRAAQVAKDQMAKMAGDMGIPPGMLP